MSSRKPLKSQRKLADKKRRRVKRLEKQGSPGRLGDHIFVTTPPDLEKMSEVIRNFMSPDLETVRDVDEFYRRISAGIMAWNLALLPEADRESAVEKTVSELGHNASPEVQATLRHVFDSLIARKLEFFPEIDRAVLDFEVRDEGTGHNFHLKVYSTPGRLPAE